MTVKEVALEVIRLAKLSNIEDQALEDEHGDTDFGSKKMMEDLVAHRPAAEALTTYLESLPPETVFKLRTLMYVGRDGSDYILDSHIDLMTDHGECDLAISSMVEKIPLPDYLQSGLLAAETSRVDIEASWPTSAPRRGQN